MTTTFGPTYAGLYDDIYATKDYAAECDAIEDVFRRFGDRIPSAVLDLGCGTGGHALILASRGYDVTGVDLSPEMIAKARRKAGDAPRMRFLRGDVRDTDAGGPYDAALLMFAVLGYQQENADVRATFANARRHLRKSGLLIFDAWYGPAVLADPPASRLRVIETAEGPVIRKTTAILDVRRHLCTVDYRLVHTMESTHAIAEESHRVRYFFPMELEAHLEAADFRLLRMGAFDDPARPPDARTWNVQVVAEAA